MGATMGNVYQVGNTVSYSVNVCQVGYNTVQTGACCQTRLLDTVYDNWNVQQNVRVFHTQRVENTIIYRVPTADKFVPGLSAFIGVI